MCESYVQPYSKPFRSASCMSSSIRENGGSGITVMPNFMWRAYSLDPRSRLARLVEGQSLALFPGRSECLVTELLASIPQRPLAHLLTDRVAVRRHPQLGSRPTRCRKQTDGLDRIAAVERADSKSPQR